MKMPGKFWIVVSTIFIFSCTEGGGEQNNDSSTGTDTSSTVPMDTGTTAPGLPTKPDCKIAGKVLDGNQFWARAENLVVVILADKETEDKDLGDSHRILEIYDGNTCQKVHREVLPVNLSPDYPYYLSEITYNNLSKVIAIRGFEKIYIYDLTNKKLVGPLVPKFLNARYVEDAQSGMINRLEVWENYMIGNAVSMGAFVFDLRNPLQPQAVLPFAEFELDKGIRYNSMFMLQSLDENDGQQLLLPNYDADKEEFRINPLFEKPRRLEVNFNKKFKNNRYLVLKEFLAGTESRPVAIDMSKMKIIDIPDEVAKKKDTEIIEWMKKNNSE